MSNMLCDQCIYYSYDEEYEEYVCGMDFADEDDYGRILQSDFRECPYFIMGDEYKIVHKQI